MKNFFIALVGAYIVLIVCPFFTSCSKGDSASMNKFPIIPAGQPWYARFSPLDSAIHDLDSNVAFTKNVTFEYDATINDTIDVATELNVCVNFLDKDTIIADNGDGLDNFAYPPVTAVRLKADAAVGDIQVKDGADWTSKSVIAVVPGHTYHVKTTIDIEKKLYSCSVDNVVICTNAAFRIHDAVTKLKSFGRIIVQASHYGGYEYSVKVSNFKILDGQ